MKKYNPQKIEPKWQKNWEKQGVFKADNGSTKQKFYCLDMFPYPSSHGLHVGHPEGYTATDIISRYKRMKGFEVMHPMGWDAFGLPAENFAIKTGVHPKETTKKSINTFKKQIKALGFSYDWDREVNTSSPEYYKWTQWIFLQLYKNGLAYKKKAAVNWCESCKTVLANEQVVDGDKCERCKNQIVPKELAQWFFKITDYVEKLLKDLDDIDWPKPIKLMQKNWIGKTSGINFKHKVKDMDIKFEVYDSIPQTFLAQTFVIVAPEHPIIKKLVASTEHEKKVLAFVDKVKKKKAIGKFDIEKDMEGIFTGRYSENYMNTGVDLPIWVASFALMDYGTGIVGCSAHDERDFDFAKKYDLPLKPVLFPKDNKLADKVRKQEIFYREPDGILEEPVDLKGISWQEAKEPIRKYIEENNFGERKINYKIRDWLISRQRYWGAPIPIIYCEKCGEVPVPEDQLPVELPEDVDFKPTGESPLTDSKTFHEVECPSCGGKAGVRREVDTMDTFVCSSWYFMRYCDSQNNKEFASKKNMKNWLPVDLYVGGAEHACMHLIYARFFHKALKDLGYIDCESDEPFLKLKNQGMILGEDHQKMSKSRGNVVNPDDIISEYGADTMRLYEMFMAAFEDVKPWQQDSIRGIYRFLEKIWKLQDKIIDDVECEICKSRILHKTIKKVSADIENFRFNTAISAMMIMVNELSSQDKISKSVYENLIILLSPFAPHMAEEIWENLGHKESTLKQSWPEYDEALCKEDEIELVLQVNGKVRDKITVGAEHSSDQKHIEKLALESDKIKKFLDNKKPKKIIFVPGKLLNIVA